MIQQGPDYSSASSSLSGDGALTYSNDSLLHSLLTLAYGANAPLHADFSLATNIIADVVALDLDTDMAITLDDGTNSETTEQTATEPGVLTFPLAPYADAGVDLSDIHTITVAVDGDSSVDLHLTLLGTEAFAEIGNFVWLDQDQNGRQDKGESGVDGVQVELYACDGDGNPDVAGGPLRVTHTSGGLYYFRQLQPGDYAVRFILPTGYEFTDQDATGVANAEDSDANPADGWTICPTLETAEKDYTWDAGLVEKNTPGLATIGDRVWEDLNANGIQDPMEPGIPEVTVELYDCDDTLLDTTTTDGSGFYAFTDLEPNQYYLKFTNPGGYMLTTQDARDNKVDTLDSDAAPPSLQTVCTKLEAGETDLTWDCGFYKTAEIGNRVWDDLNGNGIQDDDEQDVPNVTVHLLDNAGALQEAQLTDANGNYRFDGLRPGVYAIEFIPPEGYIVTLRDQGTDDSADSDAAGASPHRTFSTTLVSGESDLTWDCGLVDGGLEPAEIGDYVWEDTNANGIQDAGEQGVGGVTVHLTDCAGNRLATTTDAEGGYSFTDLTPGDYSIEFVAPAGYTFSPQDASAATEATDSDADTGTGKTVCTTLDAGETDLTWDAGLVRDEPEIVIAKEGAKACGNTRTIGFWKNNIRKHKCGRTRGTQVSKTDLLDWLDKVENFYLAEPFQLGANPLAAAYEVLSYHGSDIADKTRRQLIACELNLLSDTYAMDNTAAHAGLCKAAEDALAIGDTDALHRLHDLLDWVNNLGHESDCETIAVGDTIIYTITVTADLPEAQTAQVRDRLDSALEVVHIGDGGQYFADGHFVQWQLNLPAGHSETQLGLWVKINSLPQGDNLDAPGADWTCSDWVTLDVTNCQGGDDDDDDGCKRIERKIRTLKKRLLRFLKRKMQKRRHGRRNRWFRNRRDDDCRGLTNPHADRSTDDLCCHCPGDDDDDDDDDDCETRVLKNRACIRTTPPPPPPPGDDGENCTYTIGYWKNHPGDWPTDEVALGSETFTAEEAMDILNQPPRGDATLILGQQLIGAKLNLANGADPSEVADTIADADAWLADHPVGSDPREGSREDGIALSETLDDFNNGLIGPGHCDDEELADIEPEAEDEEEDRPAVRRKKHGKKRGRKRGWKPGGKRGRKRGGRRGGKRGGHRR